MAQAPEDAQAYFNTLLTSINVEDVPTGSIEDFLGCPLASEAVQDVVKIENLLVSNLIKNRVTAEAFYRELWWKLNDPILLSDTESKVYFLTLLWLDARTPYFEIGEGCVLNNEEYVRIAQIIQKDIDKAQFILNAGLMQKTQCASLLMEIVDSLSEEKEKAVLWSVVFSFIEERMKQRLQSAMAVEAET